MSTLIRPAQRNDALHVAALIDIAGHGIEADFWAENVDGDGSPISAARRLILDNHDLPYHLSRAWVVDIDGEIAGGLVGSLNPDAPSPAVDFPSYFEPLLELETLVPGYWAVIAVAVYREFRGRGLARTLLDHARDQAKSLSAPGLSIVVEDTNSAAISLYRRWGFVDLETRPWLPYRGRMGPRSWVLLTHRF
jgi:ribosomal protein S18 acetylase RimI-like enzyme